jgi:hypothetical protein
VRDFARSIVCPERTSATDLQWPSPRKSIVPAEIYDEQGNLWHLIERVPGETYVDQYDGVWFPIPISLTVAETYPEDCAIFLQPGTLDGHLRQLIQRGCIDVLRDLLMRPVKGYWDSDYKTAVDRYRLALNQKGLHYHSPLYFALSNTSGSLREAVVAVLVGAGANPHEPQGLFGTVTPMSYALDHDERLFAALLRSPLISLEALDDMVACSILRRPYGVLPGSALNRVGHLIDQEVRFRNSYRPLPPPPRPGWRV